MPFIGNIGAPELILIALIVLVVFGPGKLPDVASALGKGVREFRKAATDVTEATRLEPPSTPAATTPATPPVDAAAPTPPPVATAEPSSTQPASTPDSPAP
jgi:sec-independent protein translocase protein TatA